MFLTIMFPSVCPLLETWGNIGRKQCFRNWQCFLVCPGLYTLCVFTYVNSVFSVTIVPIVIYLASSRFVLMSIANIISPCAFTRNTISSGSSSVRLKVNNVDGRKVDILNHIVTVTAAVRDEQHGVGILEYAEAFLNSRKKLFIPTRKIIEIRKAHEMADKVKGTTNFLLSYI